MFSNKYYESVKHKYNYKQEPKQKLKHFSY